MSPGHRRKPLGRTGFFYCPGCGLVFLKNWISRLCDRLGCDYENSPQFKAWRRNPSAYPVDE